MYPTEGDASGPSWDFSESATEYTKKWPSPSDLLIEYKLFQWWQV